MTDRIAEIRKETVDWNFASSHPEGKMNMIKDLLARIDELEEDKQALIDGLELVLQKHNEFDDRIIDANLANPYDYYKGPAHPDNQE